MSTKAERARAAEEQAQAIEELREMFPPGSRVSVSIGYVARSGMLRTVKVYRSNADGSLDGVTWMVARATGDKVHQTHGGIVVSDCGYSATFHVVYSLGRKLYPNGFPCIGRGCASNDHANRVPGPRQNEEWQAGDMHTGDGGYSLREHQI